MSERNFYKIDGRVISTPNEDLAAEDKLVADFTRELSEAGKDSIYGEFFKTDEEKLMIRHFNEYIKAEAMEAGVDELRPPLPIKKIHFALPGGYQKQFPQYAETVKGHHDSTSDAIFVKKNKEVPRLRIAHITLHEMVHAFSATRYDFDSEGQLFYNKGGYRSVRAKNIPAESLNETSEPTVEVKELFTGFNEGVTDLMAKEILEKHQTELAQDLKLDEAENDLSTIKFHAYCPWVEWIMEKIAAKNQIDQAVVWKQFKSGLLTGNIMHLREIEKVLGPGSLRLVANIGQDPEANKAFKELMENYDRG